MKILCPHHEERTPSCEVYPDGSYYCFGCGAYGRSERTVDIVNRRKEPEDLTKANQYIDSLPVKEIRGLQLPYDAEYYYIKFPFSDYYLKRKWLKEGSKYVGPVGHKRPILNFSPYTRDREDSVLFIIEGELNAYSFREGYRNWDTISPGSANNLSYKHLSSSTAQYNNIAICVDDDAAGRQGARELQKDLVKLNKNVLVYLMEEDFNDILVKYGKEKITEIAEEIKKKLIKQGWR